MSISYLEIGTRDARKDVDIWAIWYPIMRKKASTKLGLKIILPKRIHL